MAAQRYFPLLLCLLAVAVRAADKLPQTLPDEPLEITAAHFERVGNDNTFFASGGVTGRFENATIRADKISGNPDTGELHAQGDIFFERGTTYWQGSSLDYNFITEQGEFGPSSMFFDPVYVSAESIQRVSTNVFRMQEASFTTCPKEHPHYHTSVRDAQVLNRNTVKAKGIKLYAGRVPFFWFPYLKYRVSDSVFKFRAGYGSEWGPYLQTDTTLPVAEYLDSVTEVDLYTKRGVGLGQNLELDAPSKTGVIGGYYLNDQSPYERHSDTNALREIAEDRYRLKLEYLGYENGNELNYLNTRWMYLSDPYVLEEFFKREYRTTAQPENYASLMVGQLPGLGAELFVNKRLNSFYENVDRYEYNLDLYRTKLWQTPLYFQSENSFAWLERTYSATNTLPDYSSVRLDSANAIYWPMRVGFLNVVPRGTWRGTFYDTSDSAEETEVARSIAGAGAEVSFQATKILSERERWYGKGLRHKMEPYADYSFAEASYSRTNTLHRFDRVDELDDENQVKLGLRNVLQTKRNGRTSRFIDLDLYTYYRTDRDPGQENFSNLFVDARMPLSEEMMLDLEGEYDWYTGKFPSFTTRFSLDKKDYIASLEHRYQLDDYSLWTPRVELFPDRKISVESYARYEDREGDIEEIALIGYYTHCCIRYGLGYHNYDDDHRIMFSIALTAFPDEKISSGF